MNKGSLGAQSGGKASSGIGSQAGAHAIGMRPLVMPGDPITSVVAKGGLVERVEPIEQVGTSPGAANALAAGDEAWTKALADKQLPWPALPVYVYTFVQFAGVVVVHDSRGIEQLADRAKVGQLLGDHGLEVSSIVLDGDWFEITAHHPSQQQPPATFASRVVYRVPVSNVRSARR